MAATGPAVVEPRGTVAATTPALFEQGGVACC